ncbi:MAG: hypothetical protein LBE12_08600 [Planctomycetaceae bacterium]|jgi:hypothetical protein|nr:hypothetical protein [Planctomycetaceae bacterium]
MSSKSDISVELTEQEIRCLKELGEGWETVWSRISVELVTSSGDGREDVKQKGRLYDAICRFVQDKPDLEIDDLVSFIYLQYYKEVLNKTRFLNYDYEQYGGDVYKFLCNPYIIGQMFNRYRRETAIIKTPPKQKILVQYNEPPKDQNSNETFIDLIEAKKTQSEDYDEINPFQLLITKKWVLNISPNSKGNFFQYHLHAGLQLYPRIDYTDNNMNLLQKQVHLTVENTDKSDNKPESKIEKEHQIAKKRIDEEINKLNNIVYNIQEGKIRNIDDKYKQNVNRKIAKKRLQEVFSPLDAEQIIKLFVVNRNNADKIISRYYEILVDLLPLPESTKEQYRPLFESVFQSEKGDNND